MPRTSGSLGGLSNAALAKAALAATTPLGASIGDSIATADYNGSDRVTLPPAPTNILKSAKGILTWALILCGQRVQVPTTTNIWGFPGETTATILTNLPAFHAQMPRKPAFMYVHCGTNDVKDGLPFETIVANWEAIAQFNAQRNCRTIFAPILPRTSGFSALFTAAQFQVMDRCNRWLARFAARAQGMVAVASACLPDIADPASVGAQPRAGYTYDGTHPAIAGGYYAGKAVAAILRTWYPPIDLLPCNNLAWSSGLTHASYVQNPMMEGASGTVTTPSSGTISGTAPTSWTASMSNTSGLTVAHTQVASPLTGRRMHQMTFGGSYTASGFTAAAWGPFGRLFQNPSTASLASIAAGDTIEALVEFEIDAGNNCIAFPHLQMRWKGGSNYNSDLQLPDMVGGLPSEAMSGVLRTAPHSYVAGEMPLAAGEITHNLYAYLRAENGSYTPSGTIRFGRAVIQKVD
ncbi:MAG: SGNH/GDSL hydrolase family protein [Sphingobium sp.]|uniref:SGNH/GDSL hydrolase family protein n=1 Tax=Sphingobium sp. CECT 9361 TaxID=2845384 RepID=UPI001E4F8582|nr:SGNH/GDSL hydrolase family protein [Sphingobium sp. CECT 9361]CAH0352476.1 hypothetical protein SPH9361_02102 [Sphingobium sp. CECT 9361]